MLQLTLVWATLGLLIGAFAWLARAHSIAPRALKGWKTLARWALPPAVGALTAVVGGWLATLVVERLAATAAALGFVAIGVLLIVFLPQRGLSTNAPSSASINDASAP
jgi:hypothetical protein